MSKRIELTEEYALSLANKEDEFNTLTEFEQYLAVLGVKVGLLKAVTEYTFNSIFSSLVAQKYPVDSMGCVKSLREIASLIESSLKEAQRRQVEFDKEFNSNDTESKKTAG